MINLYEIIGKSVVWGIFWTCAILGILIVIVKIKEWIEEP